MARKVTAIPATLSRYQEVPINSTKKRRVAGYARVSSDHDDQTNSYEAQVDYFTNYIKGRSDWYFAGMYSDEGITGTNTKKREGFNRMIDDALAGKIDLIITKSVSRFARNTVDSLTTIRKLKENRVECYFEKENIWTFDSKGELLLTIISSLAQEESRSISENTTWGCRKRFADGKVSVPYARFLGYDKGADGNLVVNREQAETVKLIYSWYLAGLSIYAIARELTRRGIKTGAGKSAWSGSSIRTILTNEKYKGDALLQKTFTADFLTKKKVRNEGQVQQYYVEGNHEAIITPQQFEQVQAEILRRRENKEGYSGVSIFSNKIKCGQCGGWYGSKVWHSNDKYRKVIYRCNKKYSGKKTCSSPHFTVDEIKETFIRGINSLYRNKNRIVDTLENALTAVCDTSSLESRAEGLAKEMAELAEMVDIAIAENATRAIDQERYEKYYNELVEKYEAAKIRYQQINSRIVHARAKQERIKLFLKTLREQDGLVSEFDEALWASCLDYITATSKDDIVITFKGDVEIKI